MPTAKTNERLVIVLTALEVEYAAVRRCLTDLKAHVHRAGTRFEVGVVPGGTCKVALALVGKGNQPAAVLAERAISEFDPVALVFVGIAGGLREHISLGDIVVATHVYAYHGGTSTDERLNARPRVWEAPHHLQQLAGHIVRSRTWSKRLEEDPARPAPKVHFAPIAAGEVVLQSRGSGTARWIKRHYNDAAAIEMEGAGAAQAGHLGSTPTLVIRGISDSATAEKAKTDRAGWQGVAAGRAAAFAIALISEIAAEARASGTRRSSEHDSEGNEMGARFTNVAKGRARVGAQIGQVIGNVQVGGKAGIGDELVSELAELRKALVDARNVGELDSETFAAAETELQIADSCVPVTSDSKRSKLKIALKRLRGLVEDVTTLAAKVTAVLSGLGGPR
jgi:8-oxo-dGTP diphosphatase